MIVYQIVNVVNNDFYIGKTTQTLFERYKQHRYKHKRGRTHLYKAMRKYGIENFIIIPIIELKESSVELLNEMEIKCISELNPKYNMTAGGDGGDVSSSPNYQKAIRIHIETRDNSKCASYGMLGKKQSEKFFDSIKRANSCAVSCDGLIFDSVQEAQEHFKGISVRKRLGSEKYPNFFRLRPITRRK
jgi:group I intron endonuclease